MSQQQKEETSFYSEPGFHTTKFFTENLLAREIKKSEILMKKTL